MMKELDVNKPYPTDEEIEQMPVMAEEAPAHPEIRSTEWVDELTGNWTEERCPKCGSHLLANKRGDKWCSFIGGTSIPPCDYGCESSSTAAICDGGDVKR